MLVLNQQSEYSKKQIKIDFQTSSGRHNECKIRSKVIISYKNEELLLNIVQYNIKFKVKPT